MLSYRHSFHAGNFADVLKHIVLVGILEYLARKEKGFDYVDTHAGAGRFDLKSGHAGKLEEYKDGIGKLWGGDWPGLTGYFDAIMAQNPSGHLRYYPGSPMFAAYFMRPQDKAWLFERHPDDFKKLEKNTVGDPRFRLRFEDGHQGVLSVLPPSSRRGLILFDPSYEIKSEYEQVLETLVKAHRKFSTGIYAVWYPVTERRRIRQMEQRLAETGIRDIQRFELGPGADSDEKGMTAAGMIVVNPPWGLFEKMGRLLPQLVEVLGRGEAAFFKCETLVPE